MRPLSLAQQPCGAGCRDGSGAGDERACCACCGRAAQYLTYDDFSPLMEAVLRYHPGLEFLTDTAEFQRKYAETVVFRIFFTLNR